MTENELEIRRIALRDFKYLPLFYCIPEEHAESRGLLDYPRKPMEFVTDTKWRAKYEDTHFRMNLMDTWALIIWEAFDIRGGFTNFSADHPFVQLALDFPLWTEVAAQLGLTTNFIAQHEYMPFPALMETAHNCAVMKQYLWSQPQFKLPEIQEVLREHKCHEDYRHSNYKYKQSNALKDFYRSYDHTRSKWVKKISLIHGDDEKDQTGNYSYQPNEYKDVENRLWLETFAERLNERDTEILWLMMDEYTQQEIAQILGYANHSGVNKRITHIRKEMRKYMEESNG